MLVPRGSCHEFCWLPAQLAFAHTTLQSVTVLRLFRVRFDTDHVAIRRLVRSKWSEWLPGAVVEVDIGTADYGSEMWIDARIERQIAGTLWVTRC